MFAFCMPSTAFIIYEKKRGELYCTLKMIMPAQASLVVGHLFFSAGKKIFVRVAFIRHTIYTISFLLKRVVPVVHPSRKGRVVINEYIYTLNNCDV